MAKTTYALAPTVARPATSYSADYDGNDISVFTSRGWVSLKGPKGDQGESGGPAGTVEIEDWHYVGDPGEPPFENGWASLFASNLYESRVAFRKDPAGRVYLRGIAARMSSFTGHMFTLPEDYWPEWNTRVPITVLTTGDDDLEEPHCFIEGHGSLDPDTGVITPQEEAGQVSIGALNYAGVWGSVQVMLDAVQFPTPQSEYPAGPPGPPGDPGSIIYDTDQIGTVKTFAGKVIPDNWMLADGRALPRLDYPELFDALGGVASPYGGVTSTHFDIPDLRSRFIYGASVNENVKGGAATHLLTAAESGQKSINVNTGNESGDHVHYRGQSGGLSVVAGTWSALYTGGGDIEPTTGRSSVHQHNVQVPASNAASSHNNMPPYILMAQIIKVTGLQIDAGGALVGPPGPPGNSVTVPIEAWKTVGDDGGLTAFASWIAYSASYPPQYRKRPDGIVELRGLVKGGSFGSPAFTLPPGYRPAVPGDQYFECGAYTGSAYVSGGIYITSDNNPTVGLRGRVVPYYGGAGYVSLDGIRFSTDQTDFPVGPRGPVGPSGSAAYNLPTARVATTGNVTLASPSPAVIDGVNPVDGDLILVWAQTTASENGLYRWNGGGAAMTRHSDMSSGQTIEAGTRVYVAEGTLYGQRDFYLKAGQAVGGGAILFSPPRGTVLTSQRVTTPYGSASNGWTPAHNGQQIPGLILTLTPLVNCEWEVWFQLRIDPQSATYYYVYPHMVLAPLDRDNIGAGHYALRSQHSQVQTYEPNHFKKTFRLAAGTAYTCKILWHCQGGTWNLQLNSAESWMEGRAFVSA